MMDQTAGNRIAEIERRFGRPLLWRLGLAAPPSRLTEWVCCRGRCRIGRLQIEAEREAARSQPAIGRSATTRKEGHSDEGRGKARQATVAGSQSPSPARTSPTAALAAVSTAGRATGAWSARGLLPGFRAGRHRRMKEPPGRQSLTAREDAHVNDPTSPGTIVADPEPMAYIGRAPCGCIRMAVVDDPNHKRDVAREIANAVKHGEAVERVTCEYVRQTKWTRPDCTEHARGQGALL